MLRLLVCASLALLLAASVSLAADKTAKKNKKGQAVAGTVKAINNKTLTVTVKNKKATEDKDFTIGDSVKFVTFNGGVKQETTGTTAIKDVKPGDKVRVHLDESGNVVSVQIGNAPKKPKNKNNK